MTPRREDKIFIAEITFENLKTDKIPFLDFSPTYDDTFIDWFEERISEARALVLVETMIGEGKNITKAVYKSMKELRPMLLPLEGYVKRAVDLTVPVENFGIKAVREKIDSKDAEGLDLKLAIVVTNINNNLTALTDKGYKAADFIIFKDQRVKIRTLNLSQKLQDEDQAVVVAANNVILDALDVATRDILDAGKRIFKYTNEAKLHEYTYDRLLKRIRHDNNSAPDQPPVS